jgi:YHS domain-containing protein
MNISRRSLFSIGSVLVAGGVFNKQVAAETVAQRIALSGYDPVSYFTAGHPEKGSPEFAAPFDDATYWFKSAEHRAMFLADPDRYAPQYSGFCAVMVSRGSKREADPEAWAIMDGKLYVFGVREGVPLFKQQTASVIGKANDNWQGLQKGR